MGKVERVLELFWQLHMGLRISKDSFCLEKGIDKRTFERDIRDIRNFMAETYTGQDIVYDYLSNTYYMAGAVESALTEVEYIAIRTILLGSRALRRDEMEGLLFSLRTVSEHGSTFEQSRDEDSYNQYEGNLPVKPLLKMQWDLYQCIKRKRVIRIQYLEHGLQGGRIEIIPLKLSFQDNRFMLKAVDVQEEREKTYCVEQIKDFEILGDANLQENKWDFN